MTDKLPRAPLKINSVWELLESNAQNYKEKEAIVTIDPDSGITETISHQNLFDYVEKVATFMSSLGLKKGDRQAILMHNAVEVLLFELAGAVLGVATVPLDYKRDLLERKIFKLTDTKSYALFIKEDKDNSREELPEIRKTLPKLKIISWKNFDEFNKLISNSNCLSCHCEERSDEAISNKEEDCHDPLCGSRNDQLMQDLKSTYVVLYTSGTTSHPKGVLLFTKACLLNAAGICQWQQFTNQDRFNIVLPLHHINSTIFCLSMLLCGGTIILNTRYSASKFWEVVQKFKATNSSIVPTILHDLLTRFEEFKNYNISSLRRICIGSAPVMPEETLKFYQTFGIRVVQGYGQTETALRVAGVPVDVSEKEYMEMVKSNTIGNELANNYVAIMDSNNKWKKENEEGEICIKGPTLALGYLNDKESTRKSFKGEWFHSGDLGKYKIIKGKKYFYIIGRIKEIIIKGGVNISPSAIEDVLLKNFPGVDAVSVVGIPDERMGEEIAAAIVFKKDLSEPSKKKLFYDILQKAKFAKIAGLSNYETPKQFFIFESLPKTSTGKIMRVEVKKRVAELLSNNNKKNYQVKIIKEKDKLNIKKAVAINNARFQKLKATVSEFTARAKNGLLLGVFSNDELLGTISVLRSDLTELKKVKTWKEGSANGTLKNNHSQGDSLVCVAISVKSSKKPADSLASLRGLTYYADRTKQFSNNIKITAPRSVNMNVARIDMLRKYLKSGQDHVISFHQKTKGGINGAKVWRILPNGRVEDKEAQGYNILMRYPKISRQTNIVLTPDASPSVKLIEAVLMHAKENGIVNVIAFSRPAGFREFLLNANV